VVPRPDPITRGYATTPGGQIHFWECGAGPPLVLLAPAPRSARVFRGLLPLLDGYRGVAIDTRGFGESDPPGDRMAMSDYAEDVVNVLDALAIQRAHVFGLHTGNKIAAAMAAGWPDRIDRLVLAGRTHSIVADQTARNVAVRASMDSGAGVESRSDELQHMALALTNVSKILSRMLASREVDEGAILALRDEVMDEMASGSGIESVYAANFAFDLAETLMRVKAPTLIIELVTAETEALGSQAQILQALMSNCETLAIHEHDRSLLLGYPERLAGPIRAFLGARKSL
jgi:pimeloyl-ACP methyl ester carboxylesterase